MGDLAYRKFGIFIAKEKYSSLEVKLEKLLRNERLSGLEELYNSLQSDNHRIITSFIHAITTNHTYFCRESEHFQKLATLIGSNPYKECRIWCAACSTGEEPYSITMTLLESGIRNFKIIASDLNINVLRKCNLGIYHQNRLEGVPPAIIKKYFTKIDDNSYRIHKELRRYVSLKHLNLMDTFSFPEQVDYIFCRNVLIYFNEESRNRALVNLAKNLKIGGKLFIGHAETLIVQPTNLIRIANSVYERI